MDNNRNWRGAHQNNWLSYPRNAHATKFYRIDEHIGSETRNVEFKAGPAFIQYDFRQNVAKYVSSFVNSGENGTIMIGIDDNGIVKGYRADHRLVDNIRIEIDHAIKDIQPDIFPDEYSVDFVPILDKKDHPLCNNWVIEIYVAGAKYVGRERLYETKQGVFMRRDGSVQTLSPLQIQEWTRRLYQGEIAKLKKNEENLRKDISFKMRDISNREKQLKVKEEELARREQALKTLEQNQHQQQTDNLESHIQQLQTENAALQNSTDVIQQEISEIKTMMSQQGHKKSKVCVVS